MNKRLTFLLLTALILSTACSNRTAQEISTHHQPQPNQIQNHEFLQSFGYKMSWYVIHVDELKRKNLTSQDIARHLKLTNQEKHTWNDGLSKLYEDSEQSEKIFITPNLKGYIYVICPVHEKLNLMDNLVDNYLAFTSYRVVDAVAWKVVQNQKIVRYFQYADGIDEQEFYNIGQPLSAEKQLKLPNINKLNFEQSMDVIFDDLDKNSDNNNYLAIFHEDIPSLINQHITGQNPTKLDNLSTQEISELGILGNKE